MKNKKKKRKIIHPQHFSQQILSGKLLLAVIGGQKSNLSGGFIEFHNS